MIKAQEKIQQQSSKNVHYNSYQLSTRDFLRGARFTVPSARPLHSKCDNALEKYHINDRNSLIKSPSRHQLKYRTDIKPQDKRLC